MTKVLVLTNSCVDHGRMDLSEAFAADSGPPPLDWARRAFEREYLVRILTLTAGNVTHAARLAGRNRTEFYRLLDRHSLAPSVFKPSKRGDARTALPAEPTAQR